MGKGAGRRPRPCIPNGPRAAGGDRHRLAWGFLTQCWAVGQNVCGGVGGGKRGVTTALAGSGWSPPGRRAPAHPITSGPSSRHRNPQKGPALTGTCSGLGEVLSLKLTTVLGDETPYPIAELKRCLEVGFGPGSIWHQDSWLFHQTCCLLERPSTWEGSGEVALPSPCLP